MPEEESRILREKLYEDLRELILQETEKVRDEVQPVFGEIIRQVRHFSQVRAEESEKIEDARLETEEVARILKVVSQRLDRAEQRFFAFEMDLASLMEKRKSG